VSARAGEGGQGEGYPAADRNRADHVHVDCRPCLSSIQISTDRRCPANGSRNFPSPRGSGSRARIAIRRSGSTSIGDEAAIFDWRDGSRPEDVGNSSGASVYDLTMHLNPLRREESSERSELARSRAISASRGPPELISMTVPDGAVLESPQFLRAGTP